MRALESALKAADTMVERVCAIAAVRDLGRRDVLPDTDMFDDLGWDGLDRLDFLLNVEHFLGVSFTDDDIEYLRTPRQIADVVARKLAAAGSPS